MFLNPIFIWAVIGLLFIGSEFLIPGLVIIFFGAGALLTSILSAIIPGLRWNVAMQIIVWLASSGLSLAFLRKYLSKVFRGKTIIDDGQEPSGKTAEVTERITPDQTGRVHFGGTTWTASSYSEVFEPGEVVEILKEEGLTLIVTKSIMDPVALDEVDGDNG